MSSRFLPSLPLALGAAALVLFASILSATPAWAQQQGPPDLTDGGAIPEGHTHDWNLGATGARGWMYSDRMVTHLARQIAVTAVAPGSPAEGVLEVGDVILGVGGEDFASDPRTEFGQALTRAESRAGKGRLTLKRWRDGRTRNVTIKLPVLGSWGERAPYECEKSARILEQGCAWLAARMEQPDYRPNPIPRCLNALALLASGERKYHKLVEREVQWAADYSTDSFATWYYGYVAMLIAEYTLATGDEDYLPGLRRLAAQKSQRLSLLNNAAEKYF